MLHCQPGANVKCAVDGNLQMFARLLTAHLQADSRGSYVVLGGSDGVAPCASAFPIGMMAKRVAISCTPFYIGQSHPHT